jgi:hypothetical protein
LTQFKLGRNPSALPIKQKKQGAAGITTAAPRVRGGPRQSVTMRQSIAVTTLYSRWKVHYHPWRAVGNRRNPTMLASKQTWGEIQSVTGCSRATIAKIAKRLKQAA